MQTTHTNSTTKFLPLLAVTVILAALLGFSVLGYEEPVQVTFTGQNLSWHGGSAPQPEDFVAAAPEGMELTYSYMLEPDLNQNGTQELIIFGTDAEGNQGQATVTLTIRRDVHAPQIEGPEGFTIYLGQELDLLAGVTVTDDIDPEPTLTVDESKLDRTTGGEYTVTYIARDFIGNEAVRTCTVRIIDDHKGPEILGVNKISVYLGSTVSYRRGILVRDDYTENPKLTVDSSGVDLSKEGTYPVLYRAVDDAGNETTLESTITVKKQPASFVEESVIYEKVDEVLASIIEDGMTPKEQVEAVFRWFERKCYYSNTSAKTDRLQTAYKMLVNRNGDCYYYYAACSVMLERLGLPEISVERSRNSVRGTRHYWSMVSLDGGETYYHVDVCPHYSFNGFRTCLVTDADLEKCNKSLPGYYTMDEGVYPATPKERP